MKSESFKRETSEMNSDFVDTKKANMEAEFTQQNRMKTNSLNPNIRTIDLVEANLKRRANAFENGLFRK